MRSQYLLPLWLAGSTSSYSIFASEPQQAVFHDDKLGLGHEERFRPTPEHMVPGKVDFEFDREVHYYQRQWNGSENGAMRRSSCPGINSLANRGFINRNGRNITFSEFAHAARRVWNFGDDNNMFVLGPAFGAHGWPETMDLDFFNDDKAQHVVNCPAAPTRNDRGIGDNINMNTTLYESLISFSKDGETLTLEDMAEHHFLRIQQTRRENPDFFFGSQGAICTLAQYTNMVGVLGRLGKHGLTTLYLEDVETLYLDEDIPKAYQRRESPHSYHEANAFADRMAFHVGYSITRPFPPEENVPGADICPEVPRFAKSCD